MSYYRLVEINLPKVESEFLTIKDIDIKSKRLFIRVDFNVPLDENGDPLDTTKIDRTIPTIKYAIDNGAKVILASHLGRPKGKRIPILSLKSLVDYLKEPLGREVYFVDDCIGSSVIAKIKSLKDGEVILLENLRFHREEEANCENFAEELARLADVYVNDAFGASHRAHASIDAITRFIPAVAGLLLETEIKHLSRILNSPARPFLVILAGAKVSTKIAVIKNLLNKIDDLVIAGGMVFTFLKALGFEVGKSIIEESMLETAKEIILGTVAHDVNLSLPKDYVIANFLSPDAQIKTVARDSILPGWYGVDLGPKSISHIKKLINNAATIFWNGPLGIIEIESFMNGSKEIAQAIASREAVSIVGGGDSLELIHRLQLTDRFTHTSTGGGACLEFLAGLELPGISSLKRKTAHE